MKLKHQPSIYVERKPGETVPELRARVLADPRLLPEQRISIEQDASTAFDDYVKGWWLEQPPLQITGEPK